MTTVSMPSPVAKPTPAPRSHWIGPNMPVARLGLIINLIVPGATLAWDAYRNRLGADATNFAIHTTGFLAVTYLALSLVVTPLRTITGASWLVQFRRSLGVYAFFYACAHLAIYVWFDQARNLSSAWHEIVSRYYLTIGFVSLALMLPLAATSFNGVIRAMGGKWWKRLHRLAYPAAFLACMHFWLQSKADHRIPNTYMWSLLGLFAFRIGWAAWTSATRARPAASGPMRFWKGDLVVAETIRETPSVRTIRLRSPDGGPLPFAHLAGQFIRVSLPIDGETVSRSYTIASPPGRDYIDLTVKREANGRASWHVHEMLQIGHRVSVSGPSGRFTFDKEKENAVLLIAGGVGITPVMSILRDLVDRSWPGQIDLIYSIRSADESIFARELDEIAAEHPNVRVHRTITRDAPPDWTGRRGRIDASAIRELVPDAGRRRAFVCGPNEMADAVREQLRAVGIPEWRITIESFTPVATAVPAPGVGVSANVVFARSNVSLRVEPGTTLLDAAEKHGVRIDYECRSGICGTCRCKLLDGTVTMDVRDALSEADERDGYILACRAVAQSDLVVDA